MKEKCKSNKWWNNYKYRCECKKHHIYEKDCVWNSATCNCENRRYLAGIMDDSAIICNEVIESRDEELKTILTNFNKNFYILLVFLLTTIALLIAVSIYCYLMLSDKLSSKTKTFITIPQHKTKKDPY